MSDEAVHVRWLDVFPRCNSCGRGARDAACSINTSVWVGGLSGNRIGLSIGIGTRRPASTATIVSGVAVDELLLGEGNEITGGFLVDSFKSASCRKGPA